MLAVPVGTRIDTYQRGWDFHVVVRLPDGRVGEAHGRGMIRPREAALKEALEDVTPVSEDDV